jgi:hypothetical protein
VKRNLEHLPELLICIGAVVLVCINAVVIVLGITVEVDTLLGVENVVVVVMFGIAFVTVVTVDVVTSSVDSADLDLVTTCVGA